MKNVIVLLFSLVFSNQLFAQVEKLNYPPEELKNCQFQFDDLTVEKNSKTGIKTYFFQNKKYSGCAIKYVNTTVSYYAYKFVDGKMEQLIVTYENGLLERNFHFKNGVSNGTHRMWFGDGSRYIDEIYKDGKPIKLLRWHNNGQLAREANFKNGKLVNELLYKKDGTLESKKIN